MTEKKLFCKVISGDPWQRAMNLEVIQRKWEVELMKILDFEILEINDQSKLFLKAITEVKY